MAKNQPLIGSLDVNQPEITRSELRKKRKKDKKSNGGDGDNASKVVKTKATDKDKKPKNKPNKKKKESKPRKPRPKINVSEWISDTTAAVLGAREYASSQLGAEDIQVEQQPIVTNKTAQLVTENDLKLQPEARLGYGAAIIDLMKMPVERFYYLVLWVSGNGSQDVINRSTGANYATYREQVMDPKWFERGYQTAAGQFVMAIVGDDRDDNSQAVIPALSRRLSRLTTQQQTDLANQWFQHFNSNLKGRNPERKLKKASDKNPKKAEIDENNRRIGTFINREMTHSFVMDYRFEDGEQLLTEYNYQGPDFTKTLDEKLKKKLEFQDRTSLTNAIQRFINQPLKELLSIAAPMEFYDTLYKMATNGRDTVGVPVTMSTDREDLASIINNYYQDMINRLRLSKNIATSVSKLGILNLAGLKTSDSKAPANNQRANYQAKYSYVLDSRGNQIYNEVTGQALKVRYGVLENLYQQLRKVLMMPVLVSYTQVRNDLLKQIDNGEYTKSRDVVNVDLTDPNLNAEDVAEQVARYTIDQLLGLVGKGQFDYEKGMYSKTLKEFNRMIRLDPSVRRYGGSRYRLLLKQTRHVYFWIYQSPFAEHLKPGERSDIDNHPNAFLGTDPHMVTNLLQNVRVTHRPAPTDWEDEIRFEDNIIIKLMRDQVTTTTKFVEQTAKSVSDVVKMMEQINGSGSTDLTEVRKQVAISNHTAEQAHELSVGIQPLETGINQDDLLRINLVTDKLRQNAMASLNIVNQAFYRSQMRAAGIEPKPVQKTGAKQHVAQPDKLAVMLEQSSQMINEIKQLKGKVDTTIRDSERLRRENQDGKIETYQAINQMITRLTGQKAEVDQLLTTATQAHSEARLAVDNKQRDTAMRSADEVLNLRAQVDNLSQSLAAQRVQLTELAK
ncbi:hypothetical protein OXT66_00010 [Lentilactobacillus senioris]|uniref:hypothetical protein n=1 Tax=Lentilactobacillus senioris TaxID=931534 RepID=UPI002281B939|nr:hypothetical protein [Lentilactobacillus senioris]MCY9805929.1 hypothetical protein [Lentilactobacillus senioris]